MKLLLFILLFSPCVLYSQEAPLSNEKLTTDEMINSDEEVFMVVESPPEFPCLDFGYYSENGVYIKRDYCGYEGLAKYVSENIIYPAIAKEYNIQGKVYVQFIIEKNGKVSNVKVVRGVDKNLDKEAVRVIKSSPDWKPGIQRGKAVRVYFTVPINFQLG